MSKHPSFREKVHNGIVPGMTADEYHAFPAVSSHGLNKIRRSAAHYLEERSVPYKSTPAKEFGTLVHAALLEPRRFRDNFKVRPKFDMRTTIGKGKAAMWDMEIASRPGTIVVPEDSADELLAMIKKLQAHSAANLILKGMSEVAYFWTDPVTGLECKALVDYLRQAETTVIDLKTTADASYESFQRSIMKYGYDVQAAHYCEGYFQLFKAWPNYIWLAVESESPYEIALYRATEWWIDRGKRLRARSIETLARCIASDSFPGYSAGIQDSFPPNYAMYEED